MTDPSPKEVREALASLGWDVEEGEEVAKHLWELSRPVDVLIVDHGSLVLLVPQTPAARLWLALSVNEDATWSGSRLVVEHRFARGLVEALEGAGYRTST